MIFQVNTSIQVNIQLNIMVIIVNQLSSVIAEGADDKNCGDLNLGCSKTGCLSRDY